MHKIETDPFLLHNFEIPYWWSCFFFLIPEILFLFRSCWYENKIHSSVRCHFSCHNFACESTDRHVLSIFNYFEKALKCAPKLCHIFNSVDKEL